MRSSTPRILLADPDAATLAVFEELLYREGYATVASQSARTTYRLIGTERPDMLIVSSDLDWYGAGFDLIALVRQEHTTAALPIIVCTDDMRALRKRERHLVAWNCFVLERPFREAALLTTLQAAFDSELQSRAVEG